jgi:GT2 family glycosyltransferase
MNPAAVNTAMLRFSVIICTRNRPDDLHHALKSLEESEVPVYEIIVSDDSTDLRTRTMVQSLFPSVQYLTGPKKGLSSNRNNAIRAITGSHVLFIDDDVLLAPDFFVKTGRLLQQNGRLYGNKCIVTGLENKNGAIIYPHDQTFLGFQKKPYRDGEALKTLVINSAVFPADLFKEITFDEQLIYGYEEVDFATRAVQRGYTILLLKDAVNLHFPSEINRDYYKPHIAASRLYATFKRYRFTERKMFKSLSFFIAAAFHMVLHGMKKEGGKGLAGAVRTVRSSLTYILIHNKGRRLKNTAV